MLRDANERVQMKLDELQGRYAGLALSKTDLSAQLLMTEEEKLQVSGLELLSRQNVKKVNLSK